MNDEILLTSPKQVGAYRKHKRQAFWQILFPVLLVALITLAVAVLAMVTTGGSNIPTGAHWANISAIWLIFPMLFTSLILLAILIGFIYLFMKLIQALPRLSARLLYYLDRANLIARNVGDKAVSPIIKVRTTRAGWQAFKREVRQRPVVK